MIQTMAVNFYGLTKIDFRLPENALWDACVMQWLIVSNESLKYIFSQNVLAFKMLFIV